MPFYVTGHVSKQAHGLPVSSLTYIEWGGGETSSALASPVRPVSKYDLLLMLL